LTEVSNSLARAEIEGLAINMGGSDEISQLADGMKGVVADFQELMSVAQGESRSHEHVIAPKVEG